MAQKITLVFLCMIGLVACEKMEFSPNQIVDKDLPSHINVRNIERLQQQVSKGELVRVAFIGDSQRYYDDAVAFTEKVNNMQGIDFVVLAGDISDFGLKREFEWIHDIFSKLTIPYVSVIGNHDYVGNGEDVYDKMFGPRNFSFVYKGVKFVFHDTNGREHWFNGSTPDINWIKQEFANSSNVHTIIPVSHVPPYDADFDKKLEKPYAELMRKQPKVAVSLHGHHHVTHDHYPYDDGVRYINSNSLLQRSFILLEINKGKIVKKMIAY